MISMPHLTEYAGRWCAGCDCKSCSTPPSNADPVEGTVNADGAVWGDGGWHLVKVLPVDGVWEDGDKAVCSCEWEGVSRKGTYSYTEATVDGELHTWAVSHRLLVPTDDRCSCGDSVRDCEAKRAELRRQRGLRDAEDPRWDCGSSFRRRIT
jgi:hypothetical protein